LATPIACSVQGERAAIDDNRSKASSAPSVALVDFINGKDGAAMLRPATAMMAMTNASKHLHNT